MSLMLVNTEHFNIKTPHMKHDINVIWYKRIFISGWEVIVHLDI